MDLVDGFRNGHGKIQGRLLVFFFKSSLPLYFTMSDIVHVCWTFSTNCIYDDVVGGLVQKCADVIYGWSLSMNVNV